MLKVANQIIDVHDDVNKEGMKKLAKINGNIDVMSPDKRLELKDHQFALTMITKKAAKLNKFPIADHDSTWLSNQYFEMNHHKLPLEAAGVAAYNIKTACEEFKIEPTEAVKEMAKTAASNVCYEKGNLKPKAQVKTAVIEKIAEVEQIGNNYTHAQFVLATPQHVKMAARYFEAQEEKIPLEIRQKYAAAIQRRAHELGMPPQEEVAKYASDHYNPMIEGHVASRRSLLETRPEMQKELNKIASAKKELSPAQFAAALHGLDKKAGLTQYYGGYLKNPFEATFAKEPDPRLGMRKVANQNLTPDELKNLAVLKYAKVKDYFGPYIADEFKKDPAVIFDSLPNDSKEILAGIANDTL